MERLIRPPFEQDISSRLGHGKDPFGLDPEVQEIHTAGPVLKSDGVTVSALFVDHAGIPSLVYRIDAGGRRVVITGDGKPLPAADGESFVDFCRGADLLVCECSGTAEFLAQHPW